LPGFCKVAKTVSECQGTIMDCSACELFSIPAGLGIQNGKLCVFIAVRPEFLLPFVVSLSNHERETTNA
jgi:hypothetical protein